MSQVEDSALQHAPSPAPSNGSSRIHLATVHPVQPSISAARIAATAKAAPSGSFITPAIPPPSQSTYTQRADHFATVPTVDDNGKNFTIFHARWEVAVSAAGISHLFNPNYIPPTYPRNPDDIDYAADLATYEQYTRLEAQARSHLTSRLTDKSFQKVTRNAGHVYDIWLNLIEELQVKSEVGISEMKGKWEARTWTKGGNLVEFLEEDEELIEEIRNAGGEVTDSEQRSHVLKIIPRKYKEHIDSVLSIAHIARITILMPDLIHNLKDCWRYLNPNSKSSNMTSKPKNPDVALSADSRTQSSNGFRGCSCGRGRGGNHNG